MHCEEGGQTWPEQNIIEAWLEKWKIKLSHNITYELKQKVTTYRLQREEELSARASDAAAGGPVTRIVRHTNMRGDVWHEIKRPLVDLPNDAPLYTHPASEPKALTDERIAQIWTHVSGRPFCKGSTADAFARALLRESEQQNAKP